MNIRYTNFDFDVWLGEYTVTLLYLFDVEIDPLLRESELAAIKERKEAFYLQNHCSTEDFWCQSCEYLRMLNSFNGFMELVTSSHPNLTDVGSYMTYGKEINDHNGDIVWFNIIKLLTLLQISYDDDRPTKGNI